ncbi:hypothetical protein N7449_011853 [Penicillium cf. viridicatum]|uniref:Uncharacterized protein n=1 Tax=Penicillium cf. viridicatum TaxID=2972119 RepID=A0A9W9LXI0_9EURO|nr:hypothetical protein N7449_011853 [Penicillium cf. viridicatum]
MFKTIEKDQMFQTPPLADTICIFAQGKNNAILGVTSTEEHRKILKTSQPDEKVPWGERKKARDFTRVN